MPDLQDEVALPGEFQKLAVLLAIAGDPHETLRVDVNAVLVLRPIIAFAGPAPRAQQRSILSELQDRWRRDATFAGRRIERRGLLVRRQRLRALDHPDMVVGIDGDAGRLPQ